MRNREMNLVQNVIFNLLSINLLIKTHSGRVFNSNPVDKQDSANKRISVNHHEVINHFLFFFFLFEKKKILVFYLMNLISDNLEFTSFSILVLF